jgi:L-threonylcarbamoyladenylate synthase
MHEAAAEADSGRLRGRTCACSYFHHHDDGGNDGVADNDAPEVLETEVLTAFDPVADVAAIARAAALLRAGRLVAFPTETVYGLGANATSAAAVAQIYAAKERPWSDPLIVHLADVADLDTVAAAAAIPALAWQLAERFWPGPLTLVLPRGAAIPPVVTAGGATVGVRVPSHPIARALLREVGVPLAAPSANRFMHTSPTSAAHVLADLAGRIACILDGGPCAVGVESTVLDLTTSPPRLLRPGGISLEALRSVLPAIELPVARDAAQDAAMQPHDDVARAPGQMERHYAPHARLEVFDGGDAAARDALVAATYAAVARGERVGALVPDEEVAALAAAGAQVVALGPAANLGEIARRLYAGLRALDAEGVDSIVCHTFGEVGLGLALRDRLRRAAGGKLRPLPQD